MCELLGLHWRQCGCYVELLTSSSIYKFYSKIGGKAVAGGEIKIQDPESTIASSGTLDDKLKNAATTELKKASQFHFL